MGILVGLENVIIFKMAPFIPSDKIGKVTGTAGVMYGVGGYFPPIVLGIIKQSTGSYSIGMYLIAVVGIICLALLQKEYISGAHKIVK
jgi:NNP family nitrate/nitrite transporter-like MFS transporter